MYNNLYISPSFLEAEARSERLGPFVQMARSLRRTVTPPTMAEYDDELEAPGPLGRYDLSAVAGSLRVVSPPRAGPGGLSSSEAAGAGVVTPQTPASPAAASPARGLPSSTLRSTLATPRWWSPQQQPNQPR